MNVATYETSSQIIWNSLSLHNVYHHLVYFSYETSMTEEQEPLGM